MSTPTVESLRLRALAYIRHGGVHPRDLAKLTKLDESTFRHALRRGTWSPRPSTLDAILAVIPADWQEPHEPPSQKAA